jgi:hypothetical protein
MSRRRVVALSCAALCAGLAWLAPEVLYLSVLASVDGRPQATRDTVPNAVLQAQWASVENGSMVMDRGGIWSYLLGWRHPTGLRVAGYVAEAYVRSRDLQRSWTTPVFRGHLRWKWTVGALAMWVARHWDARDATATWATSAPFGNGAVGVNAASAFYFNKTIQDLTDDEAALLAAVSYSPHMNDPACRPSAAKEARDKILGRMRAAGMLDDAATKRAIQQPIAVHSTCPGKM